MQQQVGTAMTKGAAWMVGLKLLERSIGFISTLVLARLLLPEDFGLVAMAMALLAFVEIGGQFGFDLALISKRDATRAHYDSAWTLQFGYGAVSALLLLALAWPLSLYFKEPRLVAIIVALALISLAQSTENIGIIDFRKELKFGRDFQLLLTKKLVSFTITLALAYTFRNYWALVGGYAASRVSGVLLSYKLHPYRPRFDTSEIRNLFRFSRWILLRSLLDFFIERCPEFLIGRVLNANQLGLYRVSREIATLPTTELIFPIMRAVFPGYSAIAHDRAALTRSFLQVQATIVMVALPAGLGIAMLADPIVRLLLGPNWLPSIPLIQVLGLYGAVTVFQATNFSIFNVLGIPRWGAALKAVEAVTLLALLGLLVWLEQGLLAMAWAVFAAHALVIPIGVALIQRLLKIGFWDRFRLAWRPVLASGIMLAALALLQQHRSAAVDAPSASLELLLSIPLGAASYVGSLLLLWRLAGCPEGPEQTILGLIRRRLGRPAPIQ
ncbi:lipopolysaccharide biosynthesis protein [Roseateles sp. DAIF2]|uniref:lipopolysaccharide biosynthesis protein n=1 Tax=Roseateles sp. DAIF2 TaxID=2714952 RepID=UPI0018A26256|nr:lipopolysaccharide biosynthesis protein [Roseateles sp. DAIF2]QPF73707.1 lipopolysaccharide biosynthesis protein [Roseateles sp. DAIF2]